MGNALVPPSERGVPGEIEVDRDGKGGSGRANLLVSDRHFAADREGMLARGVTHVVCCCRLLPEAYFPDDFAYLVLGLDDVDWQDLRPYVRPVSEFVEKGLAAGGNVLVHCRAGRSRSVSLCAAFLMTRRGMTLDEAFAAIRRSRSCASPNLGFWRQLRAIDREQQRQQKRQRRGSGGGSGGGAATNGEAETGGAGGAGGRR